MFGGVLMTRLARTSVLCFVLAMISAGCAQVPGSYTVVGAATPHGLVAADWPQPSVDQNAAPTPREPTVLPQATRPDDPQAKPDAARRAAAPRRYTPPVRSAAAPAASAPRDVWQRVRNGFQMRPVESSLVADWETYYASRPDYFARMIDNSAHFLYHIANEVEQRGIPLEIALLPMIESAYNPVAYSSAHASGIWQFIPSTGKNYGLKQNWWYDGRRDVIAATGAALDYLQTLHRMFNDWELALAAYNWGEGAVQRAIDRNQARGLPTDYLSLAAQMPAETRNYVPKLMAVKNIIANPSRYGLTLADVPNEPYFEVITVKRHIDLTLAARFAGMSVDEFKFLNPAHNKPVINADSAETIVLPKHKVSQFMAQMQQHADKPLVSMKTHSVRAGERPDTIAAQYGISVAELNQLNGIGGRRQIATGQTLMVPNHSDLQPALAEMALPVAMMAARPVYQNAGRRVVNNRHVAATTAHRAPVRLTGQRQTVVIKPGAHKVAYAAKPVAKIRNR
jgi:soluble lytic murein transglycosylase-like protein/LysM repeat protein